jgi:starvation-inducible DNA-binding protein
MRPNLKDVRGSWRVEILRHRNLDTMQQKATKSRRVALASTAALPADALNAIATALNTMLADVLTLYLKTRNFHWHMTGPHFHSYHAMLDEQASDILSVTDPLAERVRKLGATTLRSVGHVARLQHLLDNDSDHVAPLDMLTELRDDNFQLIQHMRGAHELCDEHGELATASLLESWIDAAERRVWFLHEATHPNGIAPR